jgi:hypothetical protein
MLTASSDRQKGLLFYIVIGVVPCLSGDHSYTWLYSICAYLVHEAVKISPQGHDLYTRKWTPRYQEYCQDFDLT